jgi:hypothetical protein
MSNLIKLVLSIAFICFLLLIGPWCFIWAINTLAVAGGATSFYIPFTFWTWLAAIVLGGMSVIPRVRRG